MRYGDPDGHGLHGQMTVVDGGERVVCHDCGRELRALPAHVYLVHGLLPAEYRKVHGLSTGQTLASPVTSAKHAAHALSTPSIVAALAASTSADVARAAMTREGQTRPQLVAIRSATGSRSRRGRDLTAEEIAELGAAADVDEWVVIVRRITGPGGTSVGAVARATGLAKQSIAYRLRRRPPPS